MDGESSDRGGWLVARLGPGTLIGGYRLDGRLGAGGMAVVFRAHDEVLDRVVALKVLMPALAEDPDFRERFIRESRAAARVDHPHIISVYAAGEADGLLYLAMRFVPGGDLRSVVLREGPLSGERAAALLLPVAAALDAAHAAGLVHRDVKLANILVDSVPGHPDHPYLSDFGIAKRSTSLTGLTGTGEFVGTPDYAAPEQITGGPVVAQTDQYALACVAYAALTGELPFVGGDGPMAVLWAHVNNPPPPVTARRPDLPAAVDDVLARALAKSPDGRYPTCTEFVAELRAAAGTAPEIPPSPASPVESEPSAVDSGPSVVDSDPSAAQLASRGRASADEATISSPAPPRMDRGDAAAAAGAPVTPGPRNRRRRAVIATVVAVALLGTVAAATLTLPRRPGAAAASPPKVSKAPSHSAGRSSPAAPTATATASRSATPTAATTPTHSSAPTAPTQAAAPASSTARVASIAPSTTASPVRYSVQLISTVTLPDGNVPAYLNVEDNQDILVASTAQSVRYAWNILATPPTSVTPPGNDLSLAFYGAAGNLVPKYGKQANVIQMEDLASRTFVAQAAAPAGTSVENYTILPNTVTPSDVYYPKSFELAVAVSNGNVYLWKFYS